MLTFAEKINTWLTPARRQAVYVIITVLATIVAASTPVLSAQVALWLQLVMAVGIVGSLVLGSIVTKSVPWTAVYRVLGVVVAAVTAMGWLSGAHADLVLRVGEQFGAIVPMIAILLRTDPSTPTGSPAAEVIPGVIVGPVVDTVTPVAATEPAASATVTALQSGATLFNPGNGALPTKTL
jgi:hypothetical protein